MKPSRRLPVYVFRDQSFSGGGDTVVCAAQADVVVSSFGGGGLYDSDGLATQFDGCAIFRDDLSGEMFMSVWGARKASRFRNALRTDETSLKIKHERPPGQLLVKLHGKRASTARK